VILQPEQNKFPDDISLDVASNGWTKGCWATILVGYGGEWQGAYSPKWGIQIDPKYVSWRIARRILGKEKSFPEVRKMRDLVLSSGLADRAIEKLNAYLKRVDDAVKSILEDVDSSGIFAETKIPPEDLIPRDCLDASTAFKQSASVTVTVTLRGKKWTFNMKAGAKPVTTTITNGFLKDYWPEVEKPWQTPPPISTALKQAESELANRIVKAVNDSLSVAGWPGSPVMLELNRRVHKNRIEYHRNRLRIVMKQARSHGLSEDEMQTIWKENLVEAIQES